MYTIQDLYDLTHTLAADYLAGFTYPWEALAGISDLIRALGAKLPEEEFDRVGEDVWIAKDATMNDPAVKAQVEACTAELGDSGRVLLRKSGTEPVLRVMSEAGTDAECEKQGDAIIAAMERSGHLIEVKK